MEFYDSKDVVPRKDHTCHLCHQITPKGVPCFYDKGKYDGEFFSRYAHSECADKWLELNRDQSSGEDWGMFEDFTSDEFDLEEHKKMIREKYKLEE